MRSKRFENVPLWRGSERSWKTVIGQMDDGKLPSISMPVNKKKVVESLGRAQRLNRSLTASAEKRLIKLILPKIPERICPLHLTILGLVGAVLTLFALLACNWRQGFISLVPLGLFVHWFGDSLDGSLARYRGIERHSFGFLIDHASDLLSMSIMLAGFGLSPFLTPISAMLILTMYLFFTSYTYLLFSVEGIHHLSYGRMGATEFRLLMAGWAVGASILRPQFEATHFFGLARIDMYVGAAAIAVLLLFPLMLWRDARRIGRLDVSALERSVFSK